ncbi:hypothetical protein BGZ74_010322 [Mortierella antarctica]|nr:hypothetical protein BGZ74_010322 [Mortierella antarctica]
MTNSSTTGKNRRFSLIRMFNASSPKSGLDTVSDAVPAVPAHYRHSMAPSMDVQSELLRERRKSIAAVTDSRSLSLDLQGSGMSEATRGTKTGPVEMTEKMRQFDELLQKRRGSTIRISLTPSLLQESS